ncbi:MAG: hypothetical protein EXR70_23585 [Deltaproteobacteria bacterium]|nr:hypothetical protein [Deltaproteobacteria bacterium]
MENNRLIADGAVEIVPDNAKNLHIRFIDRRGQKLAVLDRPVAFFIPEHIADPSIRTAGEELWVEVTIPRKGSPRPIQLGVKKVDGSIMPLAIR